MQTMNPFVTHQNCKGCLATWYTYVFMGRLSYSGKKFGCKTAERSHRVIEHSHIVGTKTEWLKLEIKIKEYEKRRKVLFRFLKWAICQAEQHPGVFLSVSVTTNIYSC